MITIKYLPEEGLEISGIQLEWGSPRSDVRNKLESHYEVDDNLIDLSTYYGGNSEFNIIQRRDIYNNINSNECLIFFNYDINNCLRDIEIHSCDLFEIDNLKIKMDEHIDEILQELIKISKKKRLLSSGEHLFEDLKLVIASNESMGGTGEELSYIYITRDISHLLKD